MNRNSPNGGLAAMAPLPGLLRRHPQTHFPIDEAFMGLAGQSVVASVWSENDEK